MPAAVLGPVLAGGIGAAAGVYGAHKQGEANKYATQSQTDMANRAAELEAKSAADALAFAREQETARQREWQMAQDRNYGLYREQQARLGPYRRLGAGSIGQLAMPIPKNPTDKPNAGTIASLIGG